MLRTFIKTVVFASLLTGSVAAAQDPYLRPSLDARQALSDDQSVIPQVHVAMTNANVVNVRNGEILRNVTVTVKDGLIVSVDSNRPRFAVLIRFANRSTPDCQEDYHRARCRAPWHLRATQR